MNYHNENDPGAAAWLRELIHAKLIPAGEVDERSIVDVKPIELRGYIQCHFFAGIGGWPLALGLAGWPGDRQVWTGSCPCQPFSVAGRQRGFYDARHLWPYWRYLVAQCRPATVFGEQVAGASDWLGLVRSDLETLEYAVGAMPIEAASAGADHLRDRFWFVADDGSRRRGEPGEGEAQQPWRAETFGAGDPNDMGFANGARRNARQPATAPVGYGSPAVATSGDRIGDEQSAWQQPEHDEDSRSRVEWVIGADGKARRVKSGIRLLADGVPGRVGLLRGFGNAIDPRSAAAFIRASIEALGF